MNKKTNTPLFCNPLFVPSSCSFLKKICQSITMARKSLIIGLLRVVDVCERSLTTSLTRADISHPS